MPNDFQLIDAEAFAQGLRDMAEGARDAGHSVRDFEDAVEEVSAATPRASATARDYASVISQLTSVLDDINGRMALNNQLAMQMRDSLQKLTTTTRQGRQGIAEMEDRVKALSAAYKSMGIEADSIKGVLGHLANRQKDYDKIMSISTAYANDRVHTNEELKQTYNSLSAQYSAIKLLINEMTVEERENNKAGEALVSTSEQIMSKMNELQIKTGKYTLQVGNYSRATNGLSLAMAQVVRETPTIMNSWSQFSMAISNNIPILVDNIQRYNTEHKEAITILNRHLADSKTMEEALAAMGDRAKNLAPTWKALAGSLLSLNTVVVALTLAFQFLTKAIDKKRKAQEEANKAVKQALTYEQMMGQATESATKKIADETTKLKVLYSISQDANRSMKERIEAANLLKEALGDEVSQTAEEIISLGNSSQAFDTLTKKTKEYAAALAYLDKIREYEASRISLEQEKQKAEEVILEQQAKIAEAEATKAEYATRDISVLMRENLERPIKKANKEIDKENEKIKKAEDAIREIDKLETDLIVKIPAAALASEKRIGGEAKRATDTLKDFYWKSEEAIIETTKEGKEKEIELARLAARKEISELQEQYDKAEGELKTYIGNVIKARRFQLGEKISSINTEYHAKELAEQKKFDDEMSKEIDATIAEQEKARLTERDSQFELDKAEARSRIKTRSDLFKELKRLEVEYWTDIFNIAKEQGNGDLMKKAEAGILNATATVYKQIRRKSNAPRNIIETLFSWGKETGTTDTNGAKIVKEEYQNLAEQINKSLSTSIGYMNDWISTRIEMAQVAIDSAKAEADAAKSLMDAEIQARANGYASNVEYARKEWEDKKNLEQKAVAEQKRLQKIQEAVNTAQQVSSLITATAGLWEASTPFGPGAPAWAIAATALMWSSFLASKAAALSLMNKETYGEGMSEYLDYGGSHASGNDIDFGVKKDGTRRRVERGEMVAVINKRNVKKYGAKNISDIISSLNHGSFDSQYGNAFEGLQMSGSGADLSTLEGDVRAIKEQGERKITYVNGKKVEVYKNTTRIFS